MSQTPSSPVEISVLLPAAAPEVAQARIRELAACLGNHRYEIIVVCPSPLTGAGVVHVAGDPAEGYAGAYQRAYQQAKGEFICYWMEDTTPTAGCFTEVLGFIKKNPGLFLAAFRLLSPTRQERAQGKIYSQLYAWRGCAARTTLEALGGLVDPAFQDALCIPDLALRVSQQGGRVAVCPDAFIKLQQATGPLESAHVRPCFASDLAVLTAKWPASGRGPADLAGTWGEIHGEFEVASALALSFPPKPFVGNEIEVTSIPPERSPHWRLSVIVSIYNAERYMHGLLEDLEKQTIAPECEIVIVETGSTQNEKAIVEEFQAIYKNIRYIRVPQRESMYSALSRAVVAARSPIVVMANADDRHFPHAFEVMVSYLEQHPEIGLVYADSGITGSANVSAEEAKLHAVFKWPEHQERLLFRGCYIGPQPMWRKSLNETLGYFDADMTIAGDMEMWLRFSQKAKFAHIPEMLGVYLQNPGGLELSNKERCDRETKTTLLRHWPKHLGELPPFNSNYAVPIGQYKPKVTPAVSPMKTDKIIALVSSFNEEDIIYHAIGDLIANGIEVYLLDNHSTDNTVEQASKWLNKGLLKIETFPALAGPENTARCKDTFVLMEILRRKEELAVQLNASWYIQADVDEFRECPWPGLTLAEGIRKVDSLGYNAINFELLNFRPTDDRFVPGTDVRQHLVSYEPGESFDALQIRAFKNPGSKVEMARNGGCNINFAGRKIFPLYFILRHYPIRGETHGRQKIYKERVPRFAAEEVAHHWHIQYNDLVNGKAEFLHKPEALTPYDQRAVCAGITGRFADDMLVANAVSGAGAIVQRPNLNALTDWIRQRLNLPANFPPEVVVQGEKAIAQLLPSQEHGYSEITAVLDPILIRLLIALLDVKISASRLGGDSLMAQVCSRLKKSLQAKLAQSDAAVPVPASA